MLREPAPCSKLDGAGAVVARTDDALLFERMAFLAAGGQLPQHPGELHPGGSERLPGIHFFLAWLDGRPIGTALAVIHEYGVLVSAVAVLPDERRRGVGAALTAAAIMAAPDRPATLSSSRLGSGTYRAMGFLEVGVPVDWRSPEST